MDVRQAVPLRGALQRHGDEVVVVAKAFGIRADAAVDDAHQVDRVHAAERADLRTGGLEAQAEAEDGAAPDASTGSLHDLRRDEVQRAELVVRSPPSPVRHLSGDRVKPIHRRPPTIASQRREG